MADRLDLPRRYRDRLEALLHEHVPGVEVWAYGSRVSGESHEGSDLDLVLRSPTREPLGAEYLDLVEALENSNIPILIQVHDWARLPESFHQEIERDYVVLQRGIGPQDASQPHSWREAPLGDLCQFRSGSVFKLKYQGEATGDYPFIKVSDMNLGANGVRILDSNNWVSRATAREIKANPLPEGTTAFAKIGEALKQNRLRMIVRPTIVDNNMMGAIPKDDVVDSRFLYYGMHQFDFGEVASGTALPYLTVSTLADLTLHLPPLPEQRAIAHVLGTLDDKIELNRRMNQTLEEMARTLFNSWFVDFDPVRAKAALTHAGGHDAVADGEPSENGAASAGEWTVNRARAYLAGMDPQIADLFPDRLVGSEIGEIPEGWEVKTLGEDFRITMGQSPPGRTYNQTGDGIPLYQGRTDFGFRYPGYRVYCNAPTRLGKPGDTLVSVRAPVGDVNMALDECCIGRGVAAVRHRTGGKSYTYYSMRALRSRFELSEADGTVFGAINKTAFNSLPWVSAGDRLVAEFDALCSPFDIRIETNEMETASIAGQREALLPKLIAGEISIGSGQ